MSRPSAVFELIQTVVGGSRKCSQGRQSGGRCQGTGAGTFSDVSPITGVSTKNGVYPQNRMCCKYPFHINLILTSCSWAAATICPCPGLQVVTRYTSCTHTDRSPLLYVHVGLPVQPTQTAWWPWPLTFDLESGFRVTCDVRYLCANFSLPRPLCSRVRPDVRDR